MGAQRKTAFVSGAGRNIGRAIAVTLAERGMDVVVNGSRDRAACEETAIRCEKHGVEAMVSMGNVGDATDVRRIAGDTISRFGTVDVLVNNAAIRPSKPFLQIDEADWRRVIEVNLYSVLYTSRAFLPGMIAEGWGRIVNFAGMNAMHGYGVGGSAISASKHGVWGMTKALAKEFGPHGITVNVVSPGPIRKEDGSAGGHASADRINNVPVGRIGEPQDISALVAFLCSHESSFITGQMIACNGGLQT